MSPIAPIEMLPSDRIAELTIIRRMLMNPTEIEQLQREVPEAALFYTDTKRGLSVLGAMLASSEPVTGESFPRRLARDIGPPDGSKEAGKLISEVFQDQVSALPSAVEDAIASIRRCAHRRNRMHLVERLEKRIEDDVDFREALASLENHERNNAQGLSGKSNLLAGEYDAFEADVDEPSPWRWSGVLPAIGAAILAKDSGEGKTWEAIEMGLACATGRALFDHYPFRGEPGHVLELLEEDARANVRSRVRQLTRGRYTADEIAMARERLHVVSHSGIQLDTEDGRGRMRAAVERTNAVLVIVDPMAEVNSQSENSSEGMMGWLKPCRAMARELGFLLLLTHHTRKGYKTQDADPKQAARGSSALKAWSDSFLVAKAVNSGTYSFVAKQRFGTEDEPAVMGFTLHRDHDQEARTMSWRVTEGIEAEVAASADAMRLLEALKAPRELLRRELEDAAKMSGKRFSEALRILETGGKVELDDVRAPDRAGRLRKQKLVRLVNPQPGYAGTTGDNRGTDPDWQGSDNRGQPRKGETPVEDAAEMFEEEQPGTNRKPYAPPAMRSIYPANIVRRFGREVGLDRVSLLTAIRRESQVSAAIAEAAVELATETGSLVERQGRFLDARSEVHA